MRHFDLIEPVRATHPTEYFQVRGTFEYAPGKSYNKQYGDDFTVRQHAATFLASTIGLPKDVSVWRCTYSTQIGVAA